MKLKSQIKSHRIVLIFLSFALILLVLWVFRYIKVFGLDISTGCQTKWCNYDLSFYGGVASYSQQEEDLQEKVIQAVDWDIDKRVGQGTFYIGWGSDGKDGSVCGVYVVWYVGYHYFREFKPTNIYTFRHKSFTFIDTCR